MPANPPFRLWYLRTLETADAKEILAACLTGSPGAWEEFLKRFHQVMVVTIVKAGGPALPMEDLIQDTYVRLCSDQNRILREARSEHPNALFGLIQAVTYSVTIDYLRRNGRLKKGSRFHVVSLQALAAEVSQPYGDDHDWPLLLKQIDSLLEQTGASPCDRTVFWLYYRQGLTVRAISLLPGIGLKESGIESMLHRLALNVRKKIGENGNKGNV